MFRYVFPLLAFILLLGEGLLAGNWTNRWQTPMELTMAASSLDRVPLVIGDWQGTRLTPINDRIAKQAGFAGHLSLRFENRQSNAIVNVLLACGPFGPLSVHTPEVCFAGGGFVQEGNRTLHAEELSRPGESAKFWKAKFAQSAPISPGHLWVFWSWNAGQGWQAPNNPRMTFGGAPVLYKLYVTNESLGQGDTAAVENCQAILRVLLPELEKSLVFKP